MTAATNSSLNVNSTGPIENTTLVGRILGSDFGEGPRMIWPTFWRTNDIPMAEIRVARVGAFRRGR